MTNPTLPELPPDDKDNPMWDALIPTPWAWESYEKLMRAYGRQCYDAGVLAERERCAAALCDELELQDERNSGAYVTCAATCAAAIRADKTD